MRGKLMRQFIVLISSCFILLSCSKVETTSIENTQTTSNKIVTVSPTVQDLKLLKPVIPNVKLNSKQKNYLNESIPPQVREILEKAESFDVLAEVRKEQFSEDDESFVFEPNRIAKITKESDKKEILEAFYSDAAREDALSACYYPYHKLRAIYREKTVEIEICFMCSKFIVESPLGKFYGIIVRENRKSEDVLKRIIKKQGVELKQ
jgi:hypothetical protein